MSSRTADNDHLRRLIDQRAARADLHGRFPSLSEFSDSPSIYSHSHFSPRIDRVDTETTPNVVHDIVYSHHRNPSVPRSPLSDRERLYIPHASSLDLEDDIRPDYPDMNANDENDTSPEGDDEETEVYRVSTYGPKMTVHSRAPWETGEDTIEEPDEGDSASKRGFKFSKVDQARKPWGLGGRSHGEPRPSIDSTRSQYKGKQSFDTVSSNVSASGALLALAQASMSSTSLIRSPSPQTGLRDRLALPRFRSRTPSSTANNMESNERSHQTGRYLDSPRSSPVSYLQAPSPTDSDFSRMDSRTSYSGPPSPYLPPTRQDYHPYANPDLVNQFIPESHPAHRLEELHALAHSAPQSPVVTRSESMATLTDSSTATTINTVSHSQSGSSSMTPGTSMASVPPAAEFSPTARSFSKGISAPMPIGTGATRSSQSPGSDEAGDHATNVNARGDGAVMPIQGLAGWSENTCSTPIKLISLEEAQAQARERSRSVTASGAVFSSPSVSMLQESESGHNPDSQATSAWARMRTVSAGGAQSRTNALASAVELHTPARVALDNSSSYNQGRGPLPHKTVVKKKSGFMRLFNGKEKAQYAYPPMPSISSDTVSSTQSSTRSRKQSSHRVPVPSITASLIEDSEGGSGSSDYRSDEGNKAFQNPALALTPRERQLSVRRNAPDLSIVTSSSPTIVVSPLAHQEPVSIPSSAASDITFSSITSPSENPRSANFVALSLRPVSTMFSADFNGISTPDSGHPSLDLDLGTPTTSTTAISPRSPMFLSAVDSVSSDPKRLLSVTSPQQEDQSIVIQALQEQIMTARRAWQQQLWELEGQVRDLKAEVEDLRSEDTKPYCTVCGRGSTARRMEGAARIEDLQKAGVKVGGVVNRPRARTGVGSRFASAT